jgi:predicted NBD/HSP70 family sugar kinase
VLAAARRGGPAFRDELVDATGLSLATVNRQVSRLLEAGLLRERPDLTPSGAVGRPRIPVEVAVDGFGVLGIHIGLRRTTLAAADLRGRVLGAVEVPNPTGEPAEVIALLVRRLRRFAARWSERRMLRVGLVVGGQLSADRDRLRHPRLGWDSVPLGAIVDRAVDSDVVVAPQVEAMAGAETWLSRRVPGGSTLYVYAREAVGATLTVDGSDEVPTGGPGTISHLPVGGTVRCHCGAVGCLEASAGDGAVAEAAHRAGLVGEPAIARVVAAAGRGDRAAHDLLVERARLLGRGVALVRDVLNPHRVVLLGQAFTAYRPALAHVSAGFAAHSALEPLTLRVSTLGSGLQALAACTTALRPVYADPLGAVRRADARLGAPASRASGGRRPRTCG